MDLDTYERAGRNSYANLARTVAAIIEKIAEGQTGYRLQQVQHRAKSVSSLRNKLVARKLLDAAEIEREIKDLAGVRVVLYTNADVARFIGSGVIGDNFEVDWARTKFHYPMAEPTADEGFISYNYVVRLKSDRLALPEFAALADLSCEVQVQTTLDHAWSEMAHDTIYKPPPPGFGAAAMKSVADRMAQIMQKYLRPAGFEFQKVAADVRAFEHARAIAEQDPLKLIAEAADNNERLNRLEAFGTALAYYDDVVARAPEFQRAMVAAVKAARRTPTRPWVVEGVSFSGVSLDRVVNEALDVLDRLRHVSEEAIEGAFQALADLFPEASDEERRRLETSLERLAKHDMRIWRVRGPLVEQRLLAAIEAMDAQRRKTQAPLVVAALRYLLQTDLTGESNTYNTFTLHMGAVVASEEYVALRCRALTILHEMVLSTDQLAEFRRILHAFQDATRLPDHGPLTADLLAAVFENGRRTVEFMTRHAGELPFEVRQEYEHDLVWRYRHNSALPPEHRANAELEAARQALQGAILAFRDAVNDDREFVIFKTLVGYQSVFPVEWDGPGSDIDAQAAFRSAAVVDLAEEVDEATFARWSSILRRCAGSPAVSGGGCVGLRSFLIELGRTKPQHLERLLDRPDDGLERFIFPMLQALEAGARQVAAETRIRGWISAREHLGEVINFLEVSTSLYPGLLGEACAAAARADDEPAVASAMGASARRYAEAADETLAAFLIGLRYFEAKASGAWVNQLWYRTRPGDFVDRLNAAVRSRLLASLANLPRLDFHAEELVAALVATNPTQLLPFFQTRLEKDRHDQAGVRFEPIPFELHALETAFSPIPNETVTAIRAWFAAGDQALFEYRGGALVARAFPDFDPVKAPLHALVERGGDEDLEFVLRVLMSYKGEAVILPLCREIVARLPADSPLLRTVDVVLDQSGVVAGEFGFVEQHKQRKAEIAPWLQDASANVRAFAEKRSKLFDLKIAADQRRALEELELRKRNYDQ